MRGGVSTVQGIPDECITHLWLNTSLHILNYSFPNLQGTCVHNTKQILVPVQLL